MTSVAVALMARTGKLRTTAAEKVEIEIKLK